MLTDLTLSTRLERAEGRSGADFVEARARLSPEVGAAWREMGGAYVLFDGPASPITQTFALGLTEPVTEGLLDEIDGFFAERGAPTFHEVSPIADDRVLQLLPARGFRPIELTAVMFRPLTPAEVAPGAAVGVVARPITDADHATWIETSVAGWSEFAEYAPMMRELGRISVERRDAQCFLAELDGQPIATGALAIAHGVAILAGASTLPSARGRGAQNALLHARLRAAEASGCDLALMCAKPGSASQRNAERHGFHIAYTRIKWGRPAAGA